MQKLYELLSQCNNHSAQARPQYSLNALVAVITSSDYVSTQVKLTYALWNRSHGANLCVCILHYASRTVTYRHVFVTVNLNRLWLPGL